MNEMMDDVRAPAEAELATRRHYLQKHGRMEVNPQHPALASTAEIIRFLQRHARNEKP